MYVIFFFFLSLDPKNLSSRTQKTILSIRKAFLFFRKIHRWRGHRLANERGQTQEHEVEARQFFRISLCFPCQVSMLMTLTDICKNSSGGIFFILPLKKMYK